MMMMIFCPIPLENSSQEMPIDLMRVIFWTAVHYGYDFKQLMELIIGITPVCLLLGPIVGKCFGNMVHGLMYL